MTEFYKPTKRPAVKNAFDLPIYGIKDVLLDPEIEAVIQTLRQGVFRYLGVADEKSEAIMVECLDFARSYRAVTEYEQSANAVLAREGVGEAIPKKLVERAQIMYEQIKPYLLAGSVLDLGCGDARLAQLLAQNGFTPMLADVYENPNVLNTGLPFRLLGQSETVPFDDNQFDNTLLLTVLHHSDDPVQVLRETRRITRPNGRIIVIESVYGVNGQEAFAGQARACTAIPCPNSRTTTPSKYLLRSFLQPRHSLYKRTNSKSKRAFQLQHSWSMETNF